MLLMFVSGSVPACVACERTLASVACEVLRASSVCMLLAYVCF